MLNLPVALGGIALDTAGGNFTAGSVPYGDGSNYLAQSNGNLFFNATTMQLAARSFRARPAAATTNDIYFEAADGQTVAVSAANEGRIRYNAAVQSFQVSENGGAWADLSVAGNAFQQDGNSFGAAAVLGTNDANSLSFETNNVTRATIAANGTTWVITQGAATTGSPVGVTYTGAAHTTLANAEAIDVNVNLARTVQFVGAAGPTTIALQRGMVIQAPIYATSGAGALTITEAATLYLSGPPTTAAGGGGTTLTAAYTLHVASGTLALGATPTLLSDNSGYLVNSSGGYSATAAGGYRFASGPTLIATSGQLQVAAQTGAFLQIELLSGQAAGSTATDCLIHSTNTRSAGLLLDVQNNTTTKFNVDSGGNTTIAGILTLSAGTLTAPSIVATGAPAQSGFYWVTAGAYGGWHTTVAGLDCGYTGIDASGFYIWAVGGSATTGAMGTVSLPALCRQGDRDTGLWFPAPDTFATTAGGVEGWRQTATANTFALPVIVNDLVGTTGTPKTLTVTQASHTGGAAMIMSLTGAATTGQTTLTETPDVLWDLSRTVTHANGNITVQRAIVFDVQTTHAFTSSSSTVANAIGLHVTSGPTQGTNAVFTSISGVFIGGDQTGAATTTTQTSATGAKFAQVKLLGDTVAYLGATAMTATPAVAGVFLNALTITSDTATLTISAVASCYIAGAPIGGTNVTLTKTYSLWIDAGLPRIDSTTANGTTATAMSSVGPAGANTTIQEWLTIDINGTTRYIPTW